MIKQTHWECRRVSSCHPQEIHSLASRLLFMLCLYRNLQFHHCSPGVGDWLIWKSVLLARGILQRPLNARAVISMQIYPLLACMYEPGQTWVPCIGIAVTQEVWEYATVKQRSAIQLPNIALSQKRQCCFCRSVLNQPKYYFRARAIIQ